MAVFGFGSRKCPGQYLAAQGVKALLVHLLRRYSIEVINECKEEKSQNTENSQVIPMADVVVQLTDREST